MMDDDDKDLLSVSGKIVRDAEWMLIIYQEGGNELPTFKLVHSPRINRSRARDVTAT